MGYNGPGGVSGSVYEDDFGFHGYYQLNAYDKKTGTIFQGWAGVEPAPGEGQLYQWSAAMNNSSTERAQGICPSGFHVPSDCEWMYLENSLGMSVYDQVGGSGYTRPSGNVASKLSTFAYQNIGDNSTGFTGLLTGGRGVFSDGGWHYYGVYSPPPNFPSYWVGGAWWWSSTKYTGAPHTPAGGGFSPRWTGAWARNFYTAPPDNGLNPNGDFSRGGMGVGGAISVRCLRN
jgi:uncharacterized protein (TIGR02145 family)